MYTGDKTTVGVSRFKMEAFSPRPKWVATANSRNQISQHCSLKHDHGCTYFWGLTEEGLKSGQW